MSWRRQLRREVGVAVALKVAALALLWALCFSAAHRLRVDAAASGRHLGLAAQPPPPAAPYVPRAEGAE